MTTRQPSRPRSKGSNTSSPGVILHKLPYKESSLILALFTREHGRLSVVAKGAKRPYSTLRSVLLPFQPLFFGWSGKNELKNLTRAELYPPMILIDGEQSLSAWYLNELLLAFLPLEDPYETLYDDYIDALRQLQAGVAASVVLRTFEWQILNDLGYGFDPCATFQGQAVLAQAWYVVLPEHGVEPYNDHWAEDQAISGMCLLDLADLVFDNPLTEKSIRRLLRKQIDYYLQGKSLSTHQVFRELQSLDLL